MPLGALLAGCWEFLHGVQDSAEVCCKLRLTLSSWRVVDETTDPSRDIGRFNVVEGRTLACTCKLHKRCKFWRNYKSAAALAQFEADMIKWLAMGFGMSDTDMHHASRSDVVKNWVTRGL